MSPDLEQKYLKESDRGAKAAKILNDEIVVDALSKIRSAIHEKWATSPIRDTEGQHELRLLLKALDEFEGYFREAMEDGNFASKTLERERTAKARLKSAVREFSA